jgi:cytidylate kinase
VIVTISREYGSGGLSIAQGIAEALGYELMADDLPKTVAARMGTSADAASQATIEPSLSERILGNLEVGTAELQIPSFPRLPGDFDEALRREMEREIRDRAQRGDVVILGKSASYVLAGMPGLVRVFLTGKREWRIARVMDAFGQSREAAIADIERVDSARRKFAKERHKIAWGDARYYDLTLDASYFGIDGSVAIVTAAVLRAQSEIA